MEGRSIWQSVWKLQIPPKVCIFLWRVINGGLATKFNKWKRKLEVVNVCDICGTGPETEHHALIVCNHAVVLCKTMREVWQLPPEEKLRDGSTEWLLRLLNSIPVVQGSELGLLP
ncbi:hypothetical protein PR202_ga10535 [Eleusine coracana subsp. coracana]|uniref:Reverse transcriptase zinc-binding domain-containing protein n=1 Tax=Eleusine coracana subsp. coracana TaxID=191504 RepID=A0AAV5C6W6_ELECO|nr:hypothetical protein PR202_ga10535 [Eleusine coracana subsp. coracana]